MSAAREALAHTRAVPTSVPGTTSSEQLRAIRALYEQIGDALNDIPESLHSQLDTFEQRRHAEAFHAIVSLVKSLDDREIDLTAVPEFEPKFFARVETAEL